LTTRVALAHAAAYAPATIESALEHLLAPLGGMPAFVKPGQKVLVKPNMLAGKTPELAVTTHPAVVRAVIRLAQQAGGRVSVGDSPGIGSPLQVAGKCGILAVIEETGAEFASFSESVKIKFQGKVFRELEIARDLLDADVILNLPKLKTHQMMGLTCGVKNLFGAVIGMRKPGLHLQAGSDKGLFALMLLELAEKLRPALTIVDAVTAMEGNGPGSGNPVHIGALLAGTNPLAVDTVAAELVGIPAEQIWTLRLARETERFGSRMAEIETVGPPVTTLRPPSFQAAKVTGIDFGLPAVLARPLGQSLSARPEPDRHRCVRCGLCVDHCPPRAMTMAGGKLRIDYQRCIHCFCCQELCPEGALVTRQGLLLRLSQFLFK
jgi:uncharacterized protein (DUF362 family)/Pyruvate/2-oxoacid:ferredoxin oxidoreductase delta subunit